MYNFTNLTISNDILLCKVWLSTATSFRVTRIEPCWKPLISLGHTDFLFTIKGFLTLITNDIFEMVRGVCQDDATKIFTDTITESFPEDTQTEASVGVTRLDIRLRCCTPLRRLRHWERNQQR